MSDSDKKGPQKIDEHTQRALDELKQAFGVTTNREVIEEALRRARKATLDQPDFC